MTESETLNNESKMRVLAKRVLLAVIGITVAGFGVAVTASALLGTSPISSLPYVVTFLCPLSFGVTTFIVNVFFFLLQVLVYKKNFPKTQWLQIPTLAWFGVCIDMGMYLCNFIPFEFYWMQVTAVLVGCFIMALGIVLELTADVIFLPGEGVVAILKHYIPKLRFGTLKIIFDFVQVIIALAVSYVFLQKIEGVREGTLISAFMVGWFIKNLKFVGDYCKRTVLMENRA